MIAISELDVASAGTCAAALAPMFEGAREFLDRLCQARPFGDEETLFAQARAIARDMPENEKIELINAHPRLGADPRSMSELSFVEQGYGRETARSASEAADAERARTATELERLNRAYEARFGFRYCVFVAGRTRADLLPDMANALTADREAEIRRALEAVVDIARDRMAKLR